MAASPFRKVSFYYFQARQHGAQRPPAHQIEGRASAVGLRGGLGARQPASSHQGTGERLAGERRAGGWLQPGTDGRASAFLDNQICVFLDFLGFEASRLIVARLIF